MNARTLERIYALAMKIADEAAEDLILFHIGPRNRWVNAKPITLGDRSARALEYLHLRNLIEYSADGKLVRFVEGGK